MQVFDAGSRSLLRQLKAHKRAAHVAHFSPDRMHVLSAADDTTVVLCTTVAPVIVDVYSLSVVGSSAYNLQHAEHHVWCTNANIGGFCSSAEAGCQPVTRMIKPKSQLLFNPNISEETI